MHILLTDETNMRPTPEAKFFIYGGLLFPIERLLGLDIGIGRIREEAGYKPEDELKFDTRARPPHVSFDAATTAKKKVVELCLASDCKFIAHIILHEVIRNQDQDEQVKSAANYVIGRYNYYLGQVGDYGICVVDNLPVGSQFRYLSEKFCLGLAVPNNRFVSLDRIKMFAASCINGSHAMSAVDIVLGSFRYCINNPRKPDIAREMILKVLQMMWHRYEPETDTYHVAGMGLITRPPVNEIRHEPYRKEYDQLFDHINGLLFDAGPRR